MGGNLRSILNEALNLSAVKGADYADVRIVDTLLQSLAVKNGKLEKISYNVNSGFGVRVLVNGSWGFASSNILNNDEAARISHLAVNIAKAGNLAQKNKVRLTLSAPVIGRYKTPIQIDPFDVPLEQKIGLLFETDKILRRDKRVAVADSGMFFIRKKTNFASSEGSLIEQEIIESGGGISATAIDGNNIERRSYPNSMGGQAQNRGYEAISDMNLIENSHRVRDEAVALLTADECPSLVTTIILDSSQLALQVHESIGHPCELDRILGMEASFAGTSFLSLDKIGEYKYGSPLVNVTADATIPGALGTFGYDDEGVPAQKSYLIKDGILTGFLTSRETAGLLGQTSNGTMRADGWNRTPLIRMTNINLLPGKWNFDDLIADTDDGIYLETNKSWSIDDKRINFQFATEIAWEIKKGKRGRMLRKPNYTGITPDFWGSCDAICDDSYWTVWGTPNCGKGEPMQVAHVAHGTSPARFRDVQVGVGR